MDLRDVGDGDDQRHGELAVLALPPRRRSERSEILARKLQAFASELEPVPTVDDVPERDPHGRMTYIINPSLEMSTGKTMAQVAHAATMSAATGRVEAWVEAGCPGRVVVLKTQKLFDTLCDDGAPSDALPMPPYSVSAAPTAGVTVPAPPAQASAGPGSGALASDCQVVGSGEDAAVTVVAGASAATADMIRSQR
jgi:hypothetical protein